jgi:hypothetical protein
MNGIIEYPPPDDCGCSTIEYVKLREWDYAFAKIENRYYELFITTKEVLRDAIKGAWHNHLPCFVCRYLNPQIVVIPNKDKIEELLIPPEICNDLLKYMKPMFNKKLTCETVVDRYELFVSGQYIDQRQHRFMRPIISSDLPVINNPAHTFANIKLHSTTSETVQTIWMTPSFLMQEILFTFANNNIFCKVGMIIVLSIDLDTINKSIEFLNKPQNLQTYWDYLL